MYSMYISTMEAGRRCPRWDMNLSWEGRDRTRVAEGKREGIGEKRRDHIMHVEKRVQANRQALSDSVCCRTTQKRGD